MLAKAIDASALWAVIAITKGRSYAMTDRGQVIMKPLRISVTDLWDPSGPKFRTEVDIEKVRETIELISLSGKGTLVSPEVWSRIEHAYEELDSNLVNDEEADIILQIATFGEVIYTNTEKRVL